MAGLVAAALLAAGCGPRNFANENDVLRARVMDLEDEIEALKLRNAELAAELEAASSAPDSLDEDVRANIPQIAEINIDRRSHVRDADDDGVNDMLVVYVKPRDGLGRFVQMVGTLTVRAELLTEFGDALDAGHVTLSPTELRAAYRSSFMGAHYTVELPITPPDEKEANHYTDRVRIIYTDGRTGMRFENQRSIALRN